MCDMADFALDDRMSEWELAMDNEFAPLHKQYELGICDELGYQYYPGTPVVDSTPFTPVRSMKVSGSGLCPRCGGETSLKSGPFGKFYGCNDFPNCKGSRNYDE